MQFRSCIPKLHRIEIKIKRLSFIRETQPFDIVVNKIQNWLAITRDCYNGHPQGIAPTPKIRR